MKHPRYDPDWSDEVKALYRHDMEEIWDPNINRHMWNQYQNQLAVYEELVGDAARCGRKSILDVGCAQATLAMKLAENGHSVVAMDLRESFLDYAKSRYTHGDIQFITGNVLEIELDQRFDTVFANQIIEHLVYPGQLVSNLKSLLNPGGRLVVTTPNWHYLKNDLPCFEMIGDPSQHEDKQFTADADGHFFAYRNDELEKIFKAEGFHFIRSRFFETPFISGHLKVRFLHKYISVKALSLLDQFFLALPFKKRLAHQLMIVGQND